MTHKLVHPSTLFVSVIVAIALCGCDREPPSPPAAVPVQTPPGEPSWDETRSVAADESRAVVERINALETYAGASRSPNARTATEWATVLEAKRKLNGVYLMTVDELDGIHAEAATRRALLEGSLFDVGEAALYFGTARASHHGRSDGHGLEPVRFRGLADEDVSISYALDYGATSFRHDLTRAAGLLADAPDVARENPWSRQAQMEAINFLLRRHAGGDVFVEPGRLNRSRVRRLLRAFEASLEDRFLGVALAKSYPVFAYRVEKSVHVYRALIDDVGRAKVRKAYLAALDENPDAMLGFYERWAKEHDIQELAELEYQWDSRNATGFWMRRIADGTDRMLFATLESTLDRASGDDR